MGAVKNAVLRDGLDPTIMDLDPDKSIESQRSTEKDEYGGESQQPPVAINDVAEENREQGEHSTVICDRDASEVVDVNSKTGPIGEGIEKKGPLPPLKDDPAYEKYFRMLKMVRRIQ